MKILKKTLSFIPGLFALLFLLALISPVYAQVDPIVGTIKAPAGIKSDIGQTGSFASVFIRAFVVIAGLYSFWQFLVAGWGYISSSGDKAKIQDSTRRLNMALIGLVLIAASFLLAALLGWALYGKASTFLVPELQTL